MDSKSIIGAVESVTKAWAKQRKAEERDSMARRRRNYYSDRVNFTEVLHCILPEAYKHASGGGQYTVAKRQMYYASRKALKAATGRDVGASYFSQTLLVKYLNENPQLNWKITADPRGTLVIPNTAHEKRIPCGTIAIDRYLRDRQFSSDEISPFPIEYPSIAEGQRYAGVLYIEKEGFEPILKEARIAERFDLAVVSCKGQSVVAARKLVDHVCRKNGGVPLFVVHDFDKSGFEICDCLTSVSEAAELANRVQYEFENEINVVDFGLRIEDVEEYDLASEECKTYDYYPDSMTDEEKDFMRQGKRVELNAFTAPELVEWLEKKLKEHLPKRLVPDDETLTKAFRRAMVINRINEAIANIIDEEEGKDSVAVPYSLRDQVVEAMSETGDPWDVALASIATDEGGEE
jgi:hypothetical protein